MNIKNLLIDFQNEKITLEQILAILKDWPVENLDFANVDHHRETRQGFPEVIYCPGKSDSQILKIIEALIKKRSAILATRANETTYRFISKKYPRLKYNSLAKVIYSSTKHKLKNNNSKLAIISAGTSDAAVAEEAYQCALVMGMNTERINDVGVAGLHRLIKYNDVLNSADAFIVVAGMEGALPTVVGGLVAAPVIAVPTSVGYGTSFQGIAALLTMLNSCANGITVVNIDNGFGAAFAAWRIIGSKKK